MTIEALNNDEGFTEDQISWFGKCLKIFQFHNIMTYCTFIHATASINAFVSPIGGILSATILDLFGRKKTLVLINVMSIISWGLIYASSKTDQNQRFWQIMLGRFLIGWFENLNLNYFKRKYFINFFSHPGVVTGLSSSPAGMTYIDHFKINSI